MNEHFPHVLVHIGNIIRGARNARVLTSVAYCEFSDADLRNSTPAGVEVLMFSIRLLRSLKAFSMFARGVRASKEDAARASASTDISFDSLSAKTEPRLDLKCSSRLAAL